MQPSEFLDHRVSGLLSENTNDLPGEPPPPNVNTRTARAGIRSTEVCRDDPAGTPLVQIMLWIWPR